MKDILTQYGATKICKKVHFIDVTGVAMLLGYREDVYWAGARALDFLLLEWFYWYKDIVKLGIASG